MKALRISLAVLLAALTAMTFVACEDDDDDPTTGSVGIVVVDSQSNDYISGATVTLGSHSLETSEIGLATFSNVEAATYDLTVTHADYQTWTGQQAVIADSVSARFVSLVPLSEETGSLQVTVLNAVDLMPIANAIVGVNGNNVTTNALGVATFANLTVGDVDVNVTHTDYFDWADTRTITAGQTTSVIAAMVGEGLSSSTCFVITDALTSNPLEGATVILNLISEITDGQGLVCFEEVASGYYDITVILEGFYTYTLEHVMVLPGVENDFSYSLTPSDGIDSDWRFVLTWLETPRDLDSHLVTPEIDGTAYHVYYGNRGSLVEAPFDSLDVDDVTSFGPETMTVTQMYPGTYHYFIYNYSGEVGLPGCGAQVAIYKDNQLLTTVTIPYEGVETHEYWNVATFDNTGEITIINQIQATQPATIYYAGQPEVIPAKMR